ncbi:MAG: hypothetical protein IKB50_03050 [Clostridia bacterium]|nr:hypothetical protein [Clostridia bacterium]
MKKFLALLMSAVLVFSLCACKRFKEDDESTVGKNEYSSMGTESEKESNSSSSYKSVNPESVLMDYIESNNKLVTKTDYSGDEESVTYLFYSDDNDSIMFCYAYGADNAGEFDSALAVTYVKLNYGSKYADITFTMPDVCVINAQIDKATFGMENEQLYNVRCTDSNGNTMSAGELEEIASGQAWIAVYEIEKILNDADIGIDIGDLGFTSF